MGQQKKWNGKVIALVTVVLFIPLLVVGLIVHQNLQKGLFSGTILHVELSFADGKEERIEEEAVIQLFLNAVESGQNTALTEEDIRKPLAEYEAVKVLFHKISEDYLFTFYFSSSANDCLYTGQEDSVIHHVQQSQAEALLKREAIYTRVMEFVSRPTVSLLLENGTEISYSKCEGTWVHIAFDGTQETEEVAETDRPPAVFLSEGETFTLLTPLTPDYVNLRLLDGGGQLIYSGNPEKMPVPRFEEEQYFKVYVDLDWYENPSRAYQGHLEFSFDLFYDQPVTYTLSANEIRPGETLILTLSRTQSQDLSVKSTFKSGEITSSVEGWEHTYFISVDPEAAPGEFALQIMGSDVNLTLPVTILPAEE